MKIITIARKSLSERTVASNVLKHGCGALNVDGCRIEGQKQSVPQPAFKSETGLVYGMAMGQGRIDSMSDNSQGRWPANLLIDGSDEVVRCFPETGPSRAGDRGTIGASVALGKFKMSYNSTSSISDNGGSAARFFKQFKVNE